jgi:bifunctional non-homologous end joining protein LigD
MVDDHTIEYGSYEGIIPEGQYGPGAVAICDAGEYIELLKFLDKRGGLVSVYIAIYKKKWAI